MSSNDNDLKMFLQKLNFQQTLKHFCQTYQTQKCIIFGAGDLANVAFDFYDFSGLNIVAVADRRYIFENEYYRNFKGIHPEEIMSYAPDVLFLLVLEPKKIKEVFKEKYPELLTLKIEDIYKKKNL